MDLKSYLDDHIEAARQLLALEDSIRGLAEDLYRALVSGHKLLVMGNGGSAADSQHLAAELVGRFLAERRALPAIALSTDTSILTAVGNDYGFETVFRRQVEALANPGDLVLGISTSGNSENVQQALQAAKDRGATTAALLGCDGGTIKGLVDRPLVVSVADTPHIQETHLMIIHVLCALLDEFIAAEKD